MSESIWDNPDFNSGGEFVTFDLPGDGVRGKVVAIGTHTWPATDTKPARVVPKLILDTEEAEKTLTAGQVQLIAKPKEPRPALADMVEITSTRPEKRPGGKILKHFVVTVERASGDAPF